MAKKTSPVENGINKTKTTLEVASEQGFGRKQKNGYDECKPGPGAKPGTDE